MMTNEVLLSKFDGGVLTLQMNRPQARNALNREMRQRLASKLSKPPEGTRLIVLKGAEDAFSAGQDLSEFDENSDVAQIMREQYYPIIDAIDALDVPLVCAVSGACAGAGVSLALAGDIVVASDASFFQIAFGRIGLVPDILVTYQLPRLIGSARAQAMALTGERVDAKDAEAWGMIWKSVPASEFETWLTEFSKALSQGPTMALGLTRNLMRDAWKLNPIAQFEREIEAQSRAAASEDFREGVQAFLEKRTPRFKGA